MAELSREMQDLEAACHELRFINNLITRICRVRESNHILQIILSELIEFSGANQGVINLVEPSINSDHATVVRKHVTETGALPFKLSTLVSGRALHEETLIKIDDIEAEPKITLQVLR